jgi:hypothetical protein
MPVWISGSDFGVYLEPPWAWILGIWGEEDRVVLRMPPDHFPRD